MEKIIMIRYGELSTKKDNIKKFIDVLEKNIKKILNGYNISITKNISRMYINIEDTDLDEIVDKLKNISGIHGIVICYKVKTDIEDIKNKSLELLLKNNFKTFKVNTNRAYKPFPYDSMKTSSMVGAHILKNIPNIKVDVHNPELILNIELRNKEDSYIYVNEIKGLGGYPVGTNDKGLLMLSGGIDSPVAGFLALKKGILIDCIYFESIPHTNIEARNKVISLSKILNKYSNNINLYIVPFTKLQETIYKNVDSDYVITIMRRMMYRIADILSKKIKAKVIINGESIGQVASQTLTSISVINSVTNVPIIRPVCCLDKLEIIDIAKKINTYDISILPYEDCCTIFVPKHPSINPDIEKCIEFEKRFNYEELIDECIQNIKKISIEDINSQYSDLL